MTNFHIHGVIAFVLERIYSMILTFNLLIAFAPSLN